MVTLDGDGKGLSEQEPDVGVRTILLVPTLECAAEVERVLADRFRKHPDRLCVELWSGRPGEAVFHAQDRFGGLPLGLIGGDEVAALEALSSGADEAMTWPAPSDAAIHGFLDRTLLRAALRREQEMSKASLVHNEKLTALGTLVAGVAHEINNPLTALQLSVSACHALIAPLSNIARDVCTLAERGGGATPAQLQALYEAARTGAPSKETQELLEEMLLSSRAIADVVRDLRVFARADTNREDAEVLNVADFVDQALRLVGREIESHGRVERDYAPSLPQLVAPPGRLTQVLINTLVNAAQAIREVERPSHRVRVTIRADEEGVAISISDTGPGVSPAAIERIFDPFYTTKRSGAGTGLGLSISRSIMRELGGDLIVESVHGEGATFVILVPVPDAETLRKAYFKTRGPMAPVKALQRAHVLVVDDDDRVLRAYARVLGRSCNVLMASDGREAIDFLRSGSTADALVSELSLPDVNGQELYEWLSNEQPRLASRMIFVSAESTAVRFQAFLAGLENPLLTKPVAANQLLSTIDRVVGRLRESGMPPSA